MFGPLLWSERRHGYAQITIESALIGVIPSIHFWPTWSMSENSMTPSVQILAQMGTKSRYRQFPNPAKWGTKKVLKVAPDRMRVREGEEGACVRQPAPRQAERHEAAGGVAE